MLHYILQIIFFQLCFLLAYELLLKKETFFNYNRWYLLLTPILAGLLPLLRLEFLAEAVAADARVMLPAVIIGKQTGMETIPAVANSAEEGLSISWWLVIYCLGFAASLGLFLKKSHQLYRLFRFRKTFEEKNFQIIEVPDSKLACTFFNTVFLGDQLSEEEKQQILQHELVHVKQKHSLDLMFFELLKIVFWLNPLIYIYQSRIAGLHEFIADKEAVKTTGKQNYYEQLLNAAFNTQNISFINQFFNHSLIKKRIIMLQKSKSKAVAKLKFLVVIPLMTLMLTYVACSDEENGSSASTNLEQYSYTLIGGEEKSSEKDAIIFQKFLSENPGYVEWRIVDHENKTVQYSIHPKDEEVPEGYTGYKILDSGKEEITRYVKEIRPDANTGPAASTGLDEVQIKEMILRDEAAPFAAIEQAPVFPNCEHIASNEERKKCTSQKISEFVNRNFDKDLAKEIGLTGTHRIIVMFKIDANGNVVEVRSRAPKPELEQETERVINSLPTMTPGKHSGETVGVMYTLPIVFNVAE